MVGVLVASLIGGSSFITARVSANRDFAFVTTSEYTVQPGDTLFGIAAVRDVPADQQVAWVAKVVVMNDLTDEDYIKPGEKLTLPGAEATAVSDRTVSAGASYVVKRGDTLLAIAAQQGVDDAASSDWIAGVAQLNGLTDVNAITEGQSLILPAAIAPAPAPATAAAPATPPPASAYEVVAGDTLLGIAEKQGVAAADQQDWVASVLKLNDLAAPELLTVGEKLTLPAVSRPTQAPVPAPAPVPTEPPPPAASATLIGATTVVQSGDTLAAIAERLGVSDAQRAGWISSVVALNGLPDADSLQVGKVLSLPAPGTSSAVTPNGHSYVVQDGDENLFSLAARFGVAPADRDAWVATVVLTNKLDANGLYPGNVIQLP
jgi:LysM repeat protein